MDKISTIYPKKPCTVVLLLYGILIKDLKTFTRIVKTDSELCLKKYLSLFTLGPDGYDRETLEDCFNSVEALKAEEIFSEEFSNVEVRGAILRYCSPGAVFGALKHKIVDSCTLHKKYPRVKIRGLYGKPDSSKIEPQDIVIEEVERDELYELIEITDRRITQFLPWGNRESVVLLKMQCPSSKKDYYEYIDKSIFEKLADEVDSEIDNKYISTIGRFFDAVNKRKVASLQSERSKPGYLIKCALAWQMRKTNGKSITVNEYSEIVSET